MACRDLNDFYCSLCKKKLREPYFQCTICHAVCLCQKCIPKGIEFDNHLSSHSVVLMRLDFHILEPGWTAAEELDLLDALLEFGASDWESVGRCLGRPAKECKDHYMRCYHSVSSNQTNPPCIPYQDSSNDPPRINQSSVLYNAFSGYNAACGDFKVDYDNDAESSIADIELDTFFTPCEGWEDEDMKLGQKLFFAVLHGYNRRLKERKKRHRIISKHGLVLLQKNFFWLRRYDDSATQWCPRGGERLPNLLSGGPSQMFKTLAKFVQLLSASKLNSLLEGLKRESDLKANLNNLYELRRNGIVSLHIAEVYKKLSQRREEFLKERRKYMTEPLLNWRNMLEGKMGKYPVIVTQSRRPPPPLDISKLPGNEKLNADERELCSVARIVPDSFIEFRNILIAECMKQNGLRLAQARTLIKIDVNKTRKIFDFLNEKGIIYQP